MGLLVVSLVGTWLLNTRVQRGLVRELGGSYFAQYFSIGIADVPYFKDESFPAAARSVAGWDKLAVLQAYGWGPDVLDHPLLKDESEELRQAVRELEGFPDDYVSGVYVIRDGEIVERFWLRPGLISPIVIEKKD